MDTRTSNRKRLRLQQKRLGNVLLFLAVAILFYWLSFRVFTAQDCEFFGSKLALLVVPACALLGNHGAAAIAFTIASASLFLAVRLHINYRQLGTHNVRRR